MGEFNEICLSFRSLVVVVVVWLWCRVFCWFLLETDPQVDIHFIRATEVEKGAHVTTSLETVVNYCVNLRKSTITSGHRLIFVSFSS